jgi:hypothetical protein
MDSGDAMALLATMEWNDARTYADPDMLRKSTTKVNDAFSKDMRNPLLLNLLAERALTKRDTAKVCF